ncbi:iron complex outermembrane recepter protein [Duganella sp. CF458]|uniref:TonB-dependent receptor n=1 Tax=Duganella sp. CF458 TaxID=1884368 RepID=UPI0008E617B4|nr:TonB-dependent receptor [Duganella sp. CF458]SFF93589.1 iron complex outermembrane recepter protein [Duganella sp. CF458]
MYKLTPLAFAAAVLASGFASAQEMPTVVVSASADASAEGLPKAYAGGQVARGGRLGLLGNMDMMDTPFNTTNYTQALIQDQQARSIADVLQNDPSVRVARGFGNYQELYVIRGFAVNSDDLAYNGLYGLLPRQFVASELLERVEVFRGANTFINGAQPGGGGIGGTINLLPKRAANRDLSSLTLGTESGGQGYAALDLGRRFGLEQRTGLRINAVRRDGDTAIDREGRELSVLSAAMDYRGDAFRVSADIGHQEHKLAGARPSVTVAGGIALPAAPDASSNFAQRWTTSNERDTFGTLRGEMDLAKDAVAWAALGARSGSEFNILAAPTVSAADGTATMYRFDNARKDNVRTGEAGVRGKLQTGSIGHRLSATMSGYWQESKNAYAMSDFLTGFATNMYRPVDVAAPPATFFTGGKMGHPLRTGKQILSSYAIADTMALDDGRWLLTAGVRHQAMKVYGYDYNTGIQNAAYDDSAVSPVAGIVFKPVKGVALYANYIEGLQQGPVASGTDIDNVGAVFAPFDSRQKEMGVKVDTGSLGFSAAVFSTGMPSAYVQNRHFGVFGEQRNRGLELSVFGNPMRGMRLLGGLTLLDAKQRRTADPATQGNAVIGVPKTQLNLGSEWDMPGVPGMSLNARAIYTSKQFADGANTQQLPSWSRIDLGLAYATRIADRAVILRARADNAFDKNYWASAGGYPGAGYLVAGAPRTITVSATVEF